MNDYKNQTNGGSNYTSTSLTRLPSSTSKIMLVDQARVKELLQDKWESALSRGKPNKI